MKIQTIFLLQWKSFVRHPLFEQTLLLRLLISIYFIGLFGLIYFAGLYLNHLSENILLFLTLILPLLDFVLKFLFKKNDPRFTSIRRFPDSNKSIFIYDLIKELFNFWNFYFLIFFLPYLTTYIYPNYGWIITVIAFGIIYTVQILLSRLVNYIKNIRTKTLYTPLKHFSLNQSPKNSIANYLSLNIKMVIRSPRLRQQLLSYLLLTIGYFYMISKQGNIYPFPMQLFLTSIIFILFPIVFNQFLFSAEATFFDRLMITPNFKNILPARYLLYLFFSFISFCTLLFLIPFDWKFLIELTAIWFYSAGSITLLSFCSILFVNNKVDLFGSQQKMMTNPPSLQSFAILLIYAFTVALVIIVSVIFSTDVAIYFMFITGIISIVFSKSWFNYLYRCFYPNKYEKMEIFRIK
ncbi:MAG: hypothetical protein EZS26_000097 [Candidatus Ordinivivax streblomastigis]|uniref:Uncharacterized protein n=1 Tax=Candidatus Ordinivivax streblomastigis TaxID=2540710 RepID=A0A5M8P5L0_9BACT|nr:MAG: hypothetical protein EZS26_000097 [Candidatus Ordinivivax streblomastigis]